MNRTGKGGFRDMTPERRKEVASLGGRLAQAKGRANRFNSETARAAAVKLGQMRREAAQRSLAGE